MRQVVSALLVAILAVGLSSCRGGGSVKPSPELGNSVRTDAPVEVPAEPVTAPAARLDLAGAVVAVVNGEIITREEVLSAISTDLERINADGTLTPERRGVMRAQLIDRELQSQAEKLLLLQEARRRLTDTDRTQIDSSVDYAMNDLVRRVGSLTQLERNLAREGKTLESRRREELENRTIRALVRREMGGRILNVRPQDMRDYYQAHPQEFRTRREVQVRQIFLQFGPRLTRSQARERGQEILDRLTAGEEFAALARQYSNDPYAAEGGLWPDYVVEGAGMLRPEVETVVMRLPVGGTSRLIQSDIGYHIVRAQDVRPERQATFAQVQREIEEKLRDELLDAKRKEFVSRLWKDANVDFRWK